MGRHDRLFKELFETFFGDLLALVVPGLRAKLEPEKATVLRNEMIVDGPEGKTRSTTMPSGCREVMRKDTWKGTSRWPGLCRA